MSPATDPGLEEFSISVYGHEAWESRTRDLPWARVEPDRMITFRNPAAGERP